MMRIHISILQTHNGMGEQPVENDRTRRFFDVEYLIPAGLVKGHQRTTVRFEATRGNEIAAVFGLRMIRPPAAR